MNPDLEIFLFIDALGWELVSETHFMEAELPFRRRIEMQFGYSSTAIPTILSGKTPAEHGHLGLFRFAPAASPFRLFRALAPLMKPASLWNRGRVRNLLSKWVKKWYGFTGYFQLYQMPFDRLPLMDYCEKSDLFAPRGMGEIENLRDLLARSGLAFHISDWHIGDRRNLAAAREAAAAGADFLFIYTAELDSLLHDHPGRPDDAVRAKLDWYCAEIAALLQTCREHGRSPRLTVFSDHGMTPLAQTADLKSAVEKTGLVFGRDYGGCFDSTMFRVTFLKPEAEPAIRQALRPFENLGHWLTEEEERRYGIYRADRSFGDAVFLMDAGVQIAPSDMGAKPLNGMHGFAPEDKDSFAVILSNDDVPPEIRRVADYFDLMKRRIEAAAARKRA